MTTSVGVSPGPVTTAPAVRRAWWRSRLDGATTPARLRLLLALLILLSLAWGVLAALTADQHASAAADVVAVSEPLSLDAEQIYTSLSDADATAASAFLAGGLEPAAARQRYQADITQAAIRIEAASALVGSSAARTQLPGHLAKQASAAGTAVGDDLAMLSGLLPAYTDEAGMARADNRLGLPLGAAYLREASALLRGTLLPAASDIYTRESALLTSSSAQATGLPLMVIAVVAGLGLGYVLYRSSLAAVPAHSPGSQLRAAAGRAGRAGLPGVAGRIVRGRPGRPAARAAAGLRACLGVRPGGGGLALRAHADESLTLIDNSGDDSYQKDYLAQQKLLGPGPGTLLAQAQAAAVTGDGQAVWMSRPRPGPGTRRTRRSARRTTPETMATRCGPR